MDSLQKAINEKRRKFREFDALPVSEQRRLREQGLDPHESILVRKRKQAKVRAEVRAEISEALKGKAPEERSEILANIGLSDDANENRIYRRTTGSLSVK